MQLQANGSSQSLTGSRNIRPSTKEAYKKVAKSVRQVALLTGEYASMIPVLKSPPEGFCPSFNAKTLANTIRYKSQYLKGHPLLDCDGNTLLDIFGGQIICAGGWSANSNLFQFVSGVAIILKARGQDGGYTEPCYACWAAYNANGERDGT